MDSLVIMNSTNQVSISLIFGFITSLILGFYLGGTHPLMQEVDRLGFKACLPSLGRGVFCMSLLVGFFFFKAANKISSPTLKKVFSKFAILNFLLVLSSVGFTLGIVGLANRI